MTTGFRVDLKYLMEYQQAGQPHWLLLRARMNIWPLVLSGMQLPAEDPA